LAHSAAVAHQAAQAAALVEPGWGEVLVDAAWLHDIGYSPTVAHCGFHPLDGARWLRDHDWPAEVCRLVAGHTRSGTEAGLRGLADELAVEFPPAPAFARSVLAWADLTSSPAGKHWSPAQRIDDILGRYPAGSVVHEATVANGPGLLEDICLIENALAETAGVGR
jgi:putative nucleotidyltransferase with HDIG domain